MPKSSNGVYLHSKPRLSNSRLFDLNVCPVTYSALLNRYATHLLDLEIFSYLHAPIENLYADRFSWNFLPKYINTGSIQNNFD